MGRRGARGGVGWGWGWGTVGVGGCGLKIRF